VARMMGEFPQRGGQIGEISPLDRRAIDRIYEVNEGGNQIMSPRTAGRPSGDLNHRIPNRSQVLNLRLQLISAEGRPCGEAPPKRPRATVRERGGNKVGCHFPSFRVVCRTMKAKQDIAESGPVAVEDDDIELTPKEEAAANRLPQTEQLAKFEKKLEHDDSGNQPS